MVRESIEARTSISEVDRARRNPFEFAGNFYELILVAGGEMNVAWTTLPLLCDIFVGFSPLTDILSDKLGILECSLCVWSKSLSGIRQDKPGESNIHFISDAGLLQGFSKYQGYKCVLATVDAL